MSVFSWVFPRRLIMVYRRFGTHYLFHLQRLDVEYEVLHTPHPAFEDGTDRVFRNVGIQQSDAGKYPKEYIHDSKHGESLKSRILLFCFLAPEDGTDCPESSVRNYHPPLNNDPEVRSFHLLRGGNLKSRLLNFYGRLGVDVLVFLYTEYKAARSSETFVTLPVDTVSHPSNNTVRTSNLANGDIPFFV